MNKYFWIFLILLFFISIHSFAQIVNFNQSFNVILFYSNSNGLSVGALEKSNLILKYSKENIYFYSSIYFLKYELYLLNLSSLSYSFYINQIWLRVPFKSCFFETGIKNDFDIEQVTIDLFSPYNRLIFQSFIGLASNSNRWQLNLKFFLSDFSIITLKWYLDEEISENSQNIFLFNFYNFFDPVQIELLAIYYQFSEKIRIGFAIKFPFILNWFFGCSLHFKPDFSFNYFETKFQASIPFSNFNFSIFWYYTSFVFDINDFISIISNQNLLLNLDELLTFNNNLFSLNLSFNPDPFISLNLSSIFIIKPFDIFFNLNLIFKFSNSLSLNISYLKNIFKENISTIHIYWQGFMNNFSDIILVELSFNLF